MITNVQHEVDLFYQIINSLRANNQSRRLADCNGRLKWPTHGVYFFTEPGEYRPDGHTPRIVRIGTHAVSANSKTKLWTRLRAHRGAKDGGGNHRGSSFRLHVGAALLERSGHSGLRLPTWGQGSSAAKDIRTAEHDHEREVSEYIGRMSIYWIEVPDAAGPSSFRSFVERNAIALLSNKLHPVDPPSATWLGLRSPRYQIQRSGLWNVDYVDEDYDPAFLNVFRGLTEQTLRGA